jgi:ubiquitin-protein ligase
MPTPQEARQIRLKNDHAEMVNIKSELVQWRAIQGNAPYVEAYELMIKVKTIIGPSPTYRDEHIIHLTLPENYPISPPEIVMQTTPQPFHPNWYQSGKWCFGSWDISEGLGHHVIRMIRTLQFDREITNPASPANGPAKDWYLSRLNGTLFPCDTTTLPDPTKSRFTIQPQTRAKFNVQS